MNTVKVGVRGSSLDDLNSTPIDKLVSSGEDFLKLVRNSTDCCRYSDDEKSAIRNFQLDRSFGDFIQKLEFTSAQVVELTELMIKGVRQQFAKSLWPDSNQGPNFASLLFTLTRIDSIFEAH